jgi:predicted ATPase/DNA-binding CsgD family transcriptional regulator
MIPNLPLQPTPFIGRNDELRTLSNFLIQSDTRLVSILGLAGVGKTRLALATAEQLVGAFGRHIYFLSLLPLSDWEDVAFAVAQSLGIQFYKSEAIQRQLASYLCDKQMLLILDNIEHLLPQTDLINHILGTAPSIKFLITSREKLNLRGEVAFVLEGFPIADEQFTQQSIESIETKEQNADHPETINADAAAYSDAVYLFMQSAQRTQTKFSVSEHNLADIKRICHLVSGNPLGIELAAAWVDSMSVAEIADEIERNNQFLEAQFNDLPPRHRSMWAAFNSSWERLPAEERESLSKLSVFSSRFTRRSVQTVVGASLRTLQSLINKSFLIYTDKGYYEIHALLRQYAASYLEADKQQEVRQAHSDYFLKLLYDQASNLKGHSQRQALNEIELEFDNIKIAWPYAIQYQNIELLGRALESLFWFCLMRNRYWEGETLFQEAETVLSQQASAAFICANIRLRRLWLRRWREGSFVLHADVIPQLESILSVFRQHEDSHLVALGLLLLGDAARIRNNDQQASPAAWSQMVSQYSQDSLEYFRTVGDDFYIAWALHFISRQAVTISGLEQAIELQQRSLNLRRQQGDLTGVIYALYNLSSDFLQTGALDLSTRAAQEMLDLSRQMGERSGVLMAQTALGLITCLQGDFARAKTLSQDILALAAALNHPLGHAYGVIIQGLCICLTNDTSQTLVAIEQLSELPTQGIVRFFRDLIIAIAAVTANTPSVAQSHLHDALLYAVAVRGTPLISWCLFVGAVWAYQQSDMKYTATLLSIGQHHSKYPLMDGWIPLQTLHEKILAKSTDSDVDYLPEAGTSNLQSTAKTLLQRLSGREETSQLSFHVLAANQSLFEPLSMRELEVLALIAEGHSNQSIADYLVVEISTVKKHITNIYGKLDVTSRTQAILRAQQLGLV